MIQKKASIDSIGTDGVPDEGEIPLSASLRNIYRPVKNDEIDEKFAVIINNNATLANVKITRLDKGSYQFGSKKIGAKVLNN